MTQPAANDNQPVLRVLQLHEGAPLPAYQTSGAAGMDLAAYFVGGITQVVLKPGDISLVTTGIKIAVPVGFEAQIRPRSGLAAKHGVTLPNSPGTIDCDYRGEVLVPLINLGREAFTVTHGMRIAQMVISPVVRVAVLPVTCLDETARGVGGFGSTGIKT